MRTMATQLRLRRLLRQHQDLSARLATEGADGRFHAAARARLAELLRDLHEAWSQESAGIRLTPVRTHVGERLADLDRALAGFGEAGGQQRVTETGLGLLLMLRGLDDVPDQQVREWLGLRELAQTA